MNDKSDRSTTNFKRRPIRRDYQRKMQNGIARMNNLTTR
jgi:hypothetical protein